MSIWLAGGKEKLCWWNMVFLLELASGDFENLLV